MAVGILDIDYYVPDREIGNDIVSEWCGVPTRWIEERTGIGARRYAPAAAPTSMLAGEAAERLLSRSRPDLAAIVVATSTPDHPQPATAAIVQERLGYPGVPAFDINAVCSGFLYALRIAAALVGEDREHRPVLLIAADKYSTIMDRTDRRTVSLFGDGAAAALVGHVPAGRGLLSQRLAAHGSLHDLVKVPAGGSRQPLDETARSRGDHFFKMDGRGVMHYALEYLPELAGEVLRDAGLTVFDIDRFIFHQGNPRLVEALATKLGADMERVPITANRFGNTGAAALPITLACAHQEKPFAAGDKILLAALGGGMTSGAAVLRWHDSGGVA